MVRNMPHHFIEKNAEHQRRAGLESALADLIERVQRLEAARLPPKLLSQEEAAMVIGVKPPTLAAWRHFGKGPPYSKIGRSCFYQTEEIDRWLDQQAIVPVSGDAA